MEQTPVPNRLFPLASGLLLAEGAPLNPADINAWDIAWSLHNLSCYNGHSPIFWSDLHRVGLAFMLMTEEAKKAKQTVPIETQVALLLSHAANAYTVDPSQRSSVLSVIYQRFGLMNNQDQNAFPGTTEIVTYVSQAIWIEWQLLFPRHAGAVEVYKKYPMNPTDVTAEKYLVGASPRDFVEALQGLCPRVQETGTLFALPPTIAPYLDADRKRTKAIGDVEDDQGLDIDNMRLR